MAWHKQGTVSLTNGTTSVTGSGTAWIANAGVGEALLAPDGRAYEIAAITADGALTLGSAYLGATASGQAYAILPSQAYIRDLAAQAADLVNAYATIASNAGAGKFGDGTLSAPGISFAADTDTGIRRIASGSMALVSNGVDAFTVSPTSVDVAETINSIKTSGVKSYAVANWTMAGYSENELQFGNAASGVGEWTEIAHYINQQKITSITASGLLVNGNVALNPTGGIRFYNAAGNSWAAISSPKTAGDSEVDFKVTTKNGSMTLDASGNLGLGVTPSAWDTYKTLEFPNIGCVASAGPYMSMMANAYYSNGIYKYKTSAAATHYAQAAGQHQWFTSPSGTAGDQITFTQGMTLDTGGNLLIGATSIGQYPIQAKSNGYNQLCAFYDSSANNTGYSVTTDGAGQVKHFATYFGTSVNCYHSWWTTTSGGSQIQAMTLDASGNLLVGATTPLPNPGFFVSQAGYFSIGNNEASSGFAFGSFLRSGVSVGSITQSGTTAVAYNTTSDHRLKTNMRPADAARFMDIEFVDFEWTDGRHDCGVIAGQLQAIYPDLVIGEVDATEMRTVEISLAIPAVTEQVLKTETVLDDGGEVIAPAVYETVEITPAVPAVTEEREFPVYQQVNYIGLIGRMGTRVQQLQRTVDAQAAMLESTRALIESMSSRIAALEGLMAT